MGLKDIAAAVEAYKKLSKEERVLFHIEAGKRRGRKAGAKKVRKVRSKHVKPDPEVEKKFPKVEKPVKQARKQVVDPATQVTQE